MCRGVPVEKCAIKEFDDRDYGVYSDLSGESVANEKYRGFSTSCKVIASNGTCCVSCSSFFHLVIWKRNHKDLNSAIHPNTPKCFLTKDDVDAQLEKERRERNTGGISSTTKLWRLKSRTTTIFLASCSGKRSTTFQKICSAFGRSS